MIEAHTVTGTFWSCAFAFVFYRLALPAAYAICELSPFANGEQSDSVFMLQRNPSQTRRAFCRNSEAGSVLKDRPVQVLAKCKAMANAALVMKPS